MLSFKDTNINKWTIIVFLLLLFGLHKCFNVSFGLLKSKMQCSTGSFVSCTWGLNIRQPRKLSLKLSDGKVRLFNNNMKDGINNKSQINKKRLTHRNIV